jgi:methylphosphotriester-DNA--protein-cysteine methyltransferase
MAAAIAEDPPMRPTSTPGPISWAGRAAALTRHFRSETGMSVVEWRQVARLQKGMELLNGGASVTTVAQPGLRQRQQFHRPVPPHPGHHAGPLCRLTSL